MAVAVDEPIWPKRAGGALKNSSKRWRRCLHSSRRSYEPPEPCRVGG